MKTLTSSLLLMLVLGMVALPVAAQDAQPTEPAQLIQSCLRLTSTEPLQDRDAAVLGALLIDGSVTVEILEAEACGPPAETSDPASDPTAEPLPGSEPGAHVDFMAHGAGAAIKLAALAQESENTKGLDGLDRAAKRLRKLVTTADQVA